VAVRTSSPPEPVPARRDWRLELRALFSWRRIVNRMRAVVRSAIVTFVVLTLTLWLMPGVASADVWDTLGLVLLVACVGAVLRPLLLVGITVLGGWGAMLLGVVAQVVVMSVALELDPANRISNLPTTVVAAILAVVFAAILDWMADSGTDDAFVREARRLMRGIRRRQARQAGGQLLTFRRPVPGVEPGMLIVQLDGVAEPVLRWAVRAGNLPTLGQWLRSGSHTIRGWHTGLPSTTPASQAGILHGASRQIPGFRWYEKDTGQLMVTNRPRDAAVIEPRLSDGRGLLRDGGVSIGNAFSGDAVTCLLTVSHAALPGRSARGWAAFMASPYGFTRALVLGVGEVFTELHQARLQRRRNLLPRVSRSGAFLALRPASMLLRDVNVSLVAEQMARGAPAIYCDLVDYDEVAHHAGPARPESMRQLESLDRMLGVLERLAHEAARRYHLVVLSDHGQSQGATFRQRYGEPIEDVVSRLVRDGHQAPGRATDEDWGRVNALLAGVAAQGGAAAATIRACVGFTSPPDGDAIAAAVVTVVSGNLAMIFMTGSTERLSVEELAIEYPDLIDDLVAHPGVGLVVGRSDVDGPVAFGACGRHRLVDGHVDGVDPLTGYGPYAARDLLAHQAVAHVGDLVLISRVDPGTDEVAAFEELVGSHGGIGGWQTEAVLVHPAGWPPGTAQLVGPDAVHHLLVGWLDWLGLRRHPVELPLPRPPSDPTGDPRTDPDSDPAQVTVFT
jgi:hypothetical protein